MNTRHVLLIAILLTVAVYANTFSNQWTYDDLPVVVENPDSHSISGFLKNSRPGRPLRELSYIPEYALFGLEPAGYHIQQIGWHAANGLLLILLMTAIGIEPVYALLGCAFFLIHPLQAESVANISNRKELLALFFCLCSLLSYIKACAASGARRAGFQSAALVLFAASLLANETAVSFACIPIFYEWLFVPPEKRLLLKRPKLFSVVVTIIVLYCIYHFRYLFSEQQILKIYSKNSSPVGTTPFPLLMADFKAFGFYLRNIIFPVGLAPEYVIRFSKSLFQWQAYLSLGLIATLAWVFRRIRVSLPVAALGIGWFFILYLPVSNIVPVAYIVADRYMYLCLPGIALIIAALLQRAESVRTSCIYGVALLILAGLTMVQNTHWRDEHSLWRHAVKVNPDSTWVQETVAQSYLMTGENEQAREHSIKALELDRFNVLAYLTRARAEENLGNLKDAVRFYEQFQIYGAFEYPREVERIRFRIIYLKGLLNQKLADKKGG